MIYIGKVRPSIMERPIEKDVIDFFKEYKPQPIVMPSDPEEQKKLKTIGLNGFIAGDMVKLIRKNENLLSRDCLILDLDDVIITEAELTTVINQKFKSFDYVLYPTISHGLKGVRYRLVIPLDVSVSEQEYQHLILFFSNKVLEGIIKQIDQSNLTWSQIQLLPALTQHIEQNQIVIHETKRKFPTKEALVSAKKWIGDTTDPSARKTKKVNTDKFKKGGSRYRSTTTDLFESLVAGCDEGNRNNRITQITGGLLARAVDVEVVLELVKIANQHFTEPLPESEVEATFFSIAKKELVN